MGLGSQFTSLLLQELGVVGHQGVYLVLVSDVERGPGEGDQNANEGQSVQAQEGGDEV